MSLGSGFGHCDAMAMTSPAASPGCSPVGRSASRRGGAALAVLVAASVLTVVSDGAVTPVARAATPQLVALGDSYASGVGTRSYYSSSASCLRSPYAYPVRVAARLGTTLRFRACAGATTGSVLESQLGALSSSTSYVTITVGGNDAGFSRVLTTCAQPRWASDCEGAVDDARTFIRRTLPGRLDTLYAAVRRRAPAAVVAVVGYPRLFNGEDCNAGTWFSPTEEVRLNDTADLLDSTLRDRARVRGFRFVDPRRPFTGHAICDDVEWLNGLSDPVRESYHPNRDGQRAYGRRVARRLG